MVGSTQRFEIPLFDGKINFMIWQSTIQDLLVQQGLDQALEDERSTFINETKWNKIQMRAVSTIQLALASSRDKTRVERDNIEYLVGKAREYLFVKVANQSPLFEDEVVSTQNGDGRRSP